MRITIWLKQRFAAQQCKKKGGIMRMKKTDVAKHASLAQLIEQVRNHRAHLIETPHQYVVIFNSGVLKLHC